tara:strand:+ start:4413 stop:4844 length:432 start_codon:yes stop_codon:yes gene_type:complete
MIKFVKADAGKKMLVGFGLSEGNIGKLMEHKPIAFPATEVQIDDPRQILILYQPPNAQPDPRVLEKLKEACCFVFTISDSAIEKMRTGEFLIQKGDDTTENRSIDFLFAIGEEFEFEKAFKKAGLIGEDTVVSHSGYSPSCAT